MNDLISRQAAIDALCMDIDIIPFAKAREYARAVIETIHNRLEELPSVQPERKMGKWIHDGYAFKGGIDWMHCSECGHKDNWDVATRTPFCAWCGAKMEGEQE